MSNAPDYLWPFCGKAAIFDFDGTLADTSHIWHSVDLAFLGKRGLPYDDDYPQRLATLGFVDGAQYTIERYGLDETVEDICAEWQTSSRDLYRSEVTLRPGAERYIMALRDQGIPCALATTNSPAVLESMQHLDVFTLFDARVYAQDVGKSKDHPDSYLEAAKRLGTNPHDCIVFEDVCNALQTVQRAGMTACGVRANDPSQPKETRDVADLWLEDWRDIVL